MSGGDLPPRQKMIGMMYLVLTALLAMNVSKSILDSFININNGIQMTAVTFDANNAFLYSAFDKAASDSPAAKKWAKKASEVKKMANDMYNHIEKLKGALIAEVEKIPEEVADTISLENVDAKDNYDAPTHLMGLAEPSKPVKVAGHEEWSGITLQEKLNKYQTGLTDIFEDKNVKEQIKEKIKYLDTPKMKNDDGKEDHWAVGMFYHIPLAAVITLLSKTQSDVRTAEAEVIAKLYERIDAGGVSFNAVRGMAVMPKAYIMDGDTFRADIFTAAYDDRVNPEIYISTGEFDTTAAYAVEKSGKFDINKIMKGTKGNAWGEGDWYQMSEKEIRAGKGNLTVREGVGVHNWGGIIKLNTKKGPKVYPFSSSFEVGKPALAISADKMNVFYIGVDNPVSVAAPMPNFTASAPGLSKKGTGWVMRPRKKGKVNIVVTGIDENGKKIPLGKAEFRVKRIPDPKSYVSGKTGSVSVKKAVFSAASTVQAKMENFDFDIKVKVQSFMFSTTKSGEVLEFKVNGNKLNSKCKSLIQRSRKNQKFFIEKIKVRMPDGTTRQLAPIIIKVI
jgi:gliding motility-associated protein GldM